MVYIIIGALVLIALMPFSVRNKTKFKQEQIEKKLLRWELIFLLQTSNNEKNEVRAK